MLVVLQEVGAGGTALAGGDQVLIAPVGVHDEDLIAIVGRPRGLKDQAFAIGRPIGFGILAAVRELADIGEVRRLRRGKRYGDGRQKELKHG